MSQAEKALKALNEFIKNSASENWYEKAMTLDGFDEPATEKANEEATEVCDIIAFKDGSQAIYKGFGWGVVTE